MGTCSCIASDIRLSQINPKTHFAMNGLNILPTEKVFDPMISLKTQSNQRDKRYSDETHDSFKRSVLSSSFKDRLQINITVLGSNSVGKSTLVIRYIEGYFEKLYIPSITKETQQKHVLYNKRPYDIHFNVMIHSDNDANANDDSGTVSEYDQTDFFLILFDLSSLVSFKEAKRIYKKAIILYHRKFKEIMNNVYLIGNKTDLNQREISQKAIDKFIHNHSMIYSEVSVKLRQNMAKLLNEIVALFDSLAFPITIIDQK